MYHCLCAGRSAFYRRSTPGAISGGVLCPPALPLLGREGRRRRGRRDDAALIEHRFTPGGDRASVDAGITKTGPDRAGPSRAELE